MVGAPPCLAEVEFESLRVVAVFSKFYGVLAQLGEHLPYKQGHRFEPIGPILFLLNYMHAAVAELERQDLKSRG